RRGSDDFNRGILMANNPATKYGNVAALLQQINGLPIHYRTLVSILEYNMRRFFMAWALAAGFFGGLVVADAQERIGRAAVIRNSSKESYRIVTPLATIGVRGTTLDFLNQRLRNIVVLQAGNARVCAAGQCVDLLNPGDTAIITLTDGKIQLTKTSAPPWSF